MFFVKNCKLSNQFFNLKFIRRKVYVTGIQPTGIPHIGNYLGFIQNFIKLQDEENTQSFLFVADLHSIATGFLTPEKFKNNITSTIAALIACGIDPEKTIFFQQSKVPEHAELAWILSGFQKITSLQRMPQYKDKSKKFKKGSVPVGLLCYPLLQAADVLLYKATHIPVGEDQNQHLNIIRHIANMFNSAFKCDYFPIPEKVFSKSPRIKSLKDPTKKMSKSDTTDWSRIFLTDSADQIFTKCKRATSDSTPNIYFDLVQRPAISNLIFLHALFSDKTVEEIIEMSKSKNTVEFKESLYYCIESKVGPIREKYKYLTQNKNSFLVELVAHGNHRAKTVASNNIAEIKQIVGFE